MVEILFLCINLERSTERRAKMEAGAYKAGFPISFIKAVDAKDIGFDAPGYDRENRLRHAPDLKLGEIACVLSHKRALETFLASSAKFAVILEDDAIFAEGFLKFVESATKLPIPWHAINLENRNKRQIWPAIAPCLYASGTLSSGSAAWLYSREGAATVLASLQSFRHAIDTHLGFFWRHRLTALCAYPMLVTQDTSNTSTHHVLARSVIERELSYPQFIRWRLERIEHSVRKRIAALSILFKMISARSNTLRQL